MQEKIAIMTDSTSDIPQHIVEQYNIQIVPLRILFGDQEYKDRLEISADEVYAGLSTEVPTTSLPAPGDVLAIFERLKEEGFTHVVAIHISSGLSGTAQMIENLARGVQGLIIRVIDSKNISMGLGYTVIEAARKLAKDADFEAVCDHVQTMLKKMKVFFVLETLEYLQRGGRIGRVAGTLGQILRIKPIITVNAEGVYETYARVRGRRQSLDRLFATVKQYLAGPMHNLAVCHGAAKEEAQDLIKRIKELGNLGELLTSHVSPVIGVHTGPGTLGLVLYETE